MNEVLTYSLEYNLGIDDGDGDLDFDCSSQESTESENEELNTDSIDVYAHATPSTDPYKPPPFSWNRVLARCQKGLSKPTLAVRKTKEEGI